MLKLIESGIYTNGKRYVSGLYLEHEYFEEGEKENYKKVEYYNVPDGTHIYCEYNEIFYTNSSLILCNNITEVDETLFDYIESGKLYRYFDENGNEVDAEDEYVDDQMIDIYQFYLIDEATADLLKSTYEPVFYCKPLDVYVLGVTHFGTSWDYVAATFTK